MELTTEMIESMVNNYRDYLVALQGLDCVRNAATCAKCCCSCAHKQFRFCEIKTKFAEDLKKIFVWKEI